MDPDSTTTLRDARAKALAARALDAARSAGAVYADVRLTNTITRDVGAEMGVVANLPVQNVELGLSVRALVNGYWGWATTPLLSIDETVRVARLATMLATRSASRGKPRAVDLGLTPVVQEGEWMTPIKIDPFTLDLVDLSDWLTGVKDELLDMGASRDSGKSTGWIQRRTGGMGFIVVNFEKQERLFASTEGSVLTQTIITTTPNIQIPYRTTQLGIPHFNTPVQAGWERISDTPIFDLFRREMDRADAAPPPLPNKPAEIGRYDMVFSAPAMAQVLAETFGNATQLDRALGYEANAGGTSYLGPDPLAWLGKSVASPLVSVTAERSTPMGLATVKWDDEGIVPIDFPLVKDGVLANYQTTREQAMWLAPWAEKQGQPVRSLGCAMAPTAQEVTMQHTPNLILHPGTHAADVDTLIQDMEHGVLIDWINVQMDFQCLDGYSALVGATEIRHGKRVAQLTGVGLQFRADQFWHDVQALGGAASTVSIGGFMSAKGEPDQRTAYSIKVVPARIKQLAVLNVLQKVS